MRLTALIFERQHLALVGPTARHADRRAIEGRKKSGIRHVASELVEQRLESEVDPGGRRRIVVRRQEQFWFEQLDERPRVADLRIGDRMDLIRHGGHVDRPELFGERPHARRDRSSAPDEDALKPEGNVTPYASVPSVITFGSKVSSDCTRLSSAFSCSEKGGEFATWSYPPLIR